jgi:hypothetical protein
LRGFLPDLFRFDYEEIRPAAARQSPISRFVVLIWGPNPTFDYYIRPRLGDIPNVVVDLSRPFEERFQLEPGDYVLICRYLDRNWSRRIAAAHNLAGTGLFFDDDYVAFLGDRSIPLLYRLDVARRSVLPLRAIRTRLTDVFVSTETLKERFRCAQAKILLPSPGTQDLEPAPSGGNGAVRIAFHAQLSHLADHAFAAEIAGRLADRTKDVAFDIVGPANARGVWARVPSAQFHSELDWPDYRERCRQLGADILIAPMLDTPLNQARSPSKAIDAVRMGAAAVFPRSRPYHGLAESSVLVESGHEAWLSALGDLVDNRDMLRDRADRLRAEVTGWAARTQPLSHVLR